MIFFCIVSYFLNAPLFSSLTFILLFTNSWFSELINNNNSMKVTSNIYGNNYNVEKKNI